MKDDMMVVRNDVSGEMQKIRESMAENRLEMQTVRDDVRKTLQEQMEIVKEIQLNMLESLKQNASFAESLLETRKTIKRMSI